MKTEWIEEYCLNKNGAEKEFKDEWNATRYLVGGKMFAMVGGDKVGEPIISLKCDPIAADVYRQQYKDVVIPGYYLNKTHWNSIYTKADFPEDELKKMIDMSYQLVFNDLTQKQKDLMS